MIDRSNRLEGDQYLNHLEQDGEALAAAAELHLDTEVPSCPGWTIDDLVAHTYEAHYFWASIAGQQLQDPEEVAERPRPPRAELISTYRAGLAELVQALRSTDPQTRVWSWSQEPDVAWIRRRMAQETAVHRWDAQSAVGSEEPIDSRLAVDGIDEFLEFFVTDLEEVPDMTVHLHATDTDGEWLIQIKDGQMGLVHEHGKGDVAVKGAASDLLLLLWGRIPEAQVQVHGDRSALFKFLELAELG